ncbi:MAG: TetR/AcrR family transcriptional regulator, partial [Ruminococcus sp.]|nr:TetR/AcrR family transcriptional regulator [Ruminococcus sp.]
MEKKPKSVDRRVLKTKRAIRNAFAKLMVEKDINDITIMELADTADINRKTFYNYYSGVYQVVEDI